MRSRYLSEVLLSSAFGGLQTFRMVNYLRRCSESPAVTVLVYFIIRIVVVGGSWSLDTILARCHPTTVDEGCSIEYDDYSGIILSFRRKIQSDNK